MSASTRGDGSVSNILGGIGHVLVLDRDGHEVGSWDNLASSPHGIWVNPAGEISLADTKHAPTGERGELRSPLLREKKCQ